MGLRWCWLRSFLTWSTVCSTSSPIRRHSVASWRRSAYILRSLPKTCLNSSFGGIKIILRGTKIFTPQKFAQRPKSDAVARGGGRAAGGEGGVCLARAWPNLFRVRVRVRVRVPGLPGQVTDSCPGSRFGLSDWRKRSICQYRFDDSEYFATIATLANYPFGQP